MIYLLLCITLTLHFCLLFTRDAALRDERRDWRGRVRG